MARQARDNTQGISQMAADKTENFDYSLLAPGPVNLHPLVREILSEPMIHHRTPEFDKILARVLQGLKSIFQTEQSVYLHTSTGSGGMESLLVNTLSPGDKVLAIVSGKFGERWAEMARYFGAKVDVLDCPWGQSIEPATVAKYLAQNPDTRAVLCQACETSTAVAHPIQELGKVIHQYPETLFLVDGITALGAYPLPMDAWHIDGLVAGSQKAFMLPTGLSLVSFSKKAEPFIEKAQFPRFYFDIRKEAKANANGETYFSSNVSLVKALDVVLKLIAEKGFEQHLLEIRSRAEFTRIFSQKLGFRLYASSPSDSVTALLVPAGIDGQKLRAHLEQKHNITVMGGQDQAKGKIIRVGHMGYIQKNEMLRLLECLGKSVMELLPASALTPELLQQVLEEAKNSEVLT